MGIFDKFKNKKEQELASETAAKATESAAPKKEEKTEGQKKLKVDVTGTLIVPVITEKSAYQVAENKYVFEVAPSASKVKVRQVVEKTYGVHVTGVNMQRVRGKWVRFGRTEGKQRNWKKAVVTLKQGERLDVYEGVATN